MFFSAPAQNRLSRSHGSFASTARPVRFLLAAMVAIASAGPMAAETARPAVTPAAAAAYGDLPLNFEANRGQADSSVRFVSHNSRYSVSLSDDGMVLGLKGVPGEKSGPATLAIKLQGTSRGVRVEGSGQLAGVANYLIGNDPKKWHTDVPTYAKVRYEGMYPGVDAVFYGNGKQLEYDFVVAPGSDPGQIAFSISGAEPKLDADSNLAMRVGDGTLLLHSPVAYQENGEKKTPVQARYVLAGDDVRIQLGKYDHARRLVIDPLLTYLSYLGGTGNDYIGTYVNQAFYTQGIALDSASNLYVTGNTTSPNFPTKTPALSPPAKPNTSNPFAYISKFNSAGALVYSTYIGGNAYDAGSAIVVDSAGEPYITGQTLSPDFPVTANAYQSVCDPSYNNSNQVVANCNNGQNNNGSSVFLLKLTAAGNAISYGTFLGGTAGSDVAYAIALDGKENVYLAGISNESCPNGPASHVFCFPTTSNALQTEEDGQYAFISVFNPAGQLTYSTLLGDYKTSVSPNGYVECTEAAGNCGTTYATGIALDSSDNFYVTGITSTASLPTTKGAFQTTAGPIAPGTSGTLEGYRGFAGKFSAVTSSGGPTLQYLTYIGGQQATDGVYPSGVAVDASGDLVVAAYASESDLPTTSGAYQKVCNNSEPAGEAYCNSAYILKLNAAGSAELWATYLGDLTGSSSNVGQAGPVTLDAAGNVYLALTGNGQDFPLVNPVGGFTGGGVAQSLVVELNPSGSQILFSSFLSDGSTNAYGSGIAVGPTGTMYFGGTTGNPTVDFPATSNAFQKTYGGGSFDGFLAVIEPAVATTTTLTAAPGTAFVGQTVTVTATVKKASGTGTPTGTVQFSAAGHVLGSATLNSSGVAALSAAASGAPAGTYPVVANYLGDDLDNPSASAAVNVVIENKYATTTTLTVSPNPIAEPATATATATVKRSASGTAQGTVTFYADGVMLAAATVNSSGKAVISLSTGGQAKGTYSATAVYSGDAEDSASTSPAVAVTLK